MSKIIYILLAFPLLVFSACQHTYVEDVDWCLKDTDKLQVEVSIALDSAFSDYITIDTLSVKTRNMDSPFLKYYVAAFRENESNPAMVVSSLDSVVRMNVKPGKYTIVGWVQYCQGSDSKGCNFYDDDFTELLLRNKYSYKPGSPSKIAYRAVDSLRLALNTRNIKMVAKPAMGRYRIIATDSAGFNPSKVVVKYTSSIPAAIHGKNGEINWWWNDISYTSPSVTSLGPEGDLLAYDYILAQDNEETILVATVEIYDEFGKVKARKNKVNIPVVNGGLTTIKGDFYSSFDSKVNSSSGGGGIGINKEYSATVEITF